MIVVAFDLDGVLADLTTPWLEIYNKDFNDNLKPEDITEWDFHKFVKPGCGINVYKYLSIPGFYRNLPVIPGSREAIKALQDMGYEVMTCSASPKAAYRDKYEWLREHFPHIPSDNIMFVRNKSLARAHILIDDGWHNLVDFSEAGGIPVVFDQPYNRELDYIRVRDFEEVKGLLTFMRDIASDLVLNSLDYGSAIVDAYHTNTENFITDAMAYLNRRVYSSGF